MPDPKPTAKRAPKVHIDIGTPDVDPKKRVIDLTVAELIEILDARICYFLEDESPAPAKVYLDCAGVAQFLGVSTGTINRLTRERGMPYHRVGDSKRFHPDEIRAWVNAQEAK